ncbi:mediator of RNA polymerase II transcription subunit 31 [Aaosphaeria arxii CBS 175.79]|uniref:Mediator of RNA polymerase II transcription subunit 31 n=1 Tax=Aaosphaeria arxii CBS 175.79 TaxID=1450172 RepID=A0A6A5Y5R9_9PLEO|nr:mediator of RNA polymerase II transcription subunit 31 [Aaosphaeria arxii CBS 175.79]KAF2020629.1 mediator of RNA polymerase II transcription subunit 31 [Aaosphaeria arxii CBS 175.79]
MAAAPPSADASYGGFSRFELELEFVQCLANPAYLNYLASQKYFDQPEFVAYLGYLQYFKHPKYAKYLHHPGPTLRTLELLQHEKFRSDTIDPNLTNNMTMAVFRNAVPDKAD